MARKIILSVIYIIAGISINLYMYQYAFNNVLVSIFDLNPITLWQTFALQIVIGPFIANKTLQEQKKDNTFATFEKIAWEHIGKCVFVISIIYLIKDFL